MLRIATSNEILGEEELACEKVDEKVGTNSPGKLVGPRRKKSWNNEAVRGSI